MNVLAPMMANVWRVLVEPGQLVTAGQSLTVLESMKIEVPVDAPAQGTVVEVRVAEGDVVEEGQVLVVLDVG